VADICAALALGCSLLRRLGLGGEADRLEALFSAVESRLGSDQLAEDSEDSEDPGASAASPSPLSWS
jgi:hypothetical protein